MQTGFSGATDPPAVTGSATHALGVSGIGPQASHQRLFVRVSRDLGLVNSTPTPQASPLVANGLPIETGAVSPILERVGGDIR